MNTTVITSMKKMITVAATATMLLVLNPFNSNANGEKGKNPASEGFTVQYTGSSERGIMFNVQFENPSAQKFILIIKNADGDVLYRAQFNDAHFNKSVLFVKEEDVINPTFILRTADNQEVKQTLEVRRKVVEDIVVTKL